MTLIAHFPSFRVSVPRFGEWRRLRLAYQLVNRYMTHASCFKLLFCVGRVTLHGLMCAGCQMSSSSHPSDATPPELKRAPPPTPGDAGASNDDSALATFSLADMGKALPSLPGEAIDGAVGSARVAGVGGGAETSAVGDAHKDPVVVGQHPELAAAAEKHPVTTVPLSTSPEVVVERTAAPTPASVPDGGVVIMGGDIRPPPLPLPLWEAKQNGGGAAADSAAAATPGERGLTDFLRVAYGIIDHLVPAEAVQAKVAVRNNMNLIKDDAASRCALLNALSRALCVKSDPARAVLFAFVNFEQLRPTHEESAAILGHKLFEAVRHRSGPWWSSNSASRSGESVHNTASNMGGAVAGNHHCDIHFGLTSDCPAICDAWTSALEAGTSLLSSFSWPIPDPSVSEDDFEAQTVRVFNEIRGSGAEWKVSVGRSFDAVPKRWHSFADRVALSRCLNDKEREKVLTDSWLMKPAVAADSWYWEGKSGYSVGGPAALDWYGNNILPTAVFMPAKNAVPDYVRIGHVPHPLTGSNLTFCVPLGCGESKKPLGDAVPEAAGQLAIALAGICEFFLHVGVKNPVVIGRVIAKNYMVQYFGCWYDARQVYKNYIVRPVGTRMALNNAANATDIRRYEAALHAHEELLRTQVEGCAIKLLILNAAADPVQPGTDNGSSGSWVAKTSVPYWLTPEFLQWSEWAARGVKLHGLLDAGGDDSCVLTGTQHGVDVVVKLYVRKPHKTLSILERVRGCPNVMQVLDHFDVGTSGYHAIVTPWYKGAGVLPDTTDVDGQRAYVTQLSDALMGCHARGVVHLDVRKQNVCYHAASRQLRLIDFDNGELKDSPTSEWWVNRALAEGRIASFHSSAPPEYEVGAVADGAAADGWWLGALLILELLRGPVPTSGDVSAWRELLGDAASALRRQEPQDRVSIADAIAPLRTPEISPPQQLCSGPDAPVSVGCAGRQG